jgi:hypothetical protein
MPRVSSDALKRMTRWSTNALSLVALAGFWFHTSQDKVVFGKYSTRYFLVLCVLTALATVPGLTLRFLLTEHAIVSSSGRRVTLALGTKLLAVVILPAMLLVSAEALFTHWYRATQSAKWAQYHPFLQKIPRPRDEGLVINRWGFRGEEIERAKPAGVYRTFVLGGSTVFCDGVAFEDSHCRILEKWLRAAYPSVRVEVQNAGMDWHTSQHSLIKFLFQIQDFDPDLIIVYHAINDLCRSFSPPRIARGEFQSDYGHFNGPVADMVNDHFGNARYHRFFVVDQIHALVSQQWFSDFKVGAKPVTVTHWRSLASFERNMRDLATIIRSKQIDLVLASQPYLYKTTMTEEEKSKLWFLDFQCRNREERADIASMARGMDAFNRTSRAIARDHGVLFVDLEQLVPKTLEYFVDDVHYTPAGNQLIGEVLGREVIGQGFVEKKFPAARR